MKKTVLSCLLTSLISASEPLIVKSSINDNVSFIKQEQVISKNAKKSFNPTAPSFTKKIIEMMILMSKHEGFEVVIIQKKQNHHIIMLIY